VLRLSREVEIIAHPDVWADKCISLDQKMQFAGVPFSRWELESLGARFHLVREPVRVTDHIMTGCCKIERAKVATGIPQSCK
jgi:hypothetical protein